LFKDGLENHIMGLVQENMAIIVYLIELLKKRREEHKKQY